MNEPIISADGHVNESPEMWPRIPEQFRSAAATRVEKRDDGFLALTLMGNDIVVPPPAVAMDDELRVKEFRNDTTGGSDLAVRTQKQLLDGVHAEVVFPNTLSMRASDYFRRQGAVTITDDPVAINNLGLTGTDCLMWGNDYPHDEGTYPSSAQHRDASATTHAQARAIFAGNAARIYGFNLDAISRSLAA